MEHDKARQSLREELIRESRDSVRQFSERDDILAAILIGSAAWGKPNPDGDLDILLITGGQGHVFYCYLMPRFCSVRRRTEIGYIPHEHALKRIGESYGSLLSCGLIEQLKNGMVLFQKDGHGDALIESSQKALPSRLLVGKLIGDISKAVKESDENAGKGLYAEAAMTSRQVARLAVRAILLAREKIGVSKEKHEYRAVSKYLREHETTCYEGSMGVDRMTEEDACRTVKMTIDLIRRVLDERRISSNLIEYGWLMTKS